MPDSGLKVLKMPRWSLQAPSCTQHVLRVLGDFLTTRNFLDWYLSDAGSQLAHDPELANASTSSVEHLFGASFAPTLASLVLAAPWLQ